MTKKIRIFSDHPIHSLDQDSFQFSVYSQALTDAILSADTPITFGIFGGWGTGKTSLMRMIYNSLYEKEEQESVFPVWFDAWRFENEPNLIVPLLYTIRDEIKERHPDVKSNNPYAKLAGFLDLFIKALASGLEVGLKNENFSVNYSYKDSIKAMEEMVKKAEDVPSDAKSPYFDLFKYLRHFITNLSPNRLVIFVDDLDRCQPNKAFAILESMKLAMNFSGIIFVVGTDRQMVEQITAATKSVENYKIDGAAFIRKIFQVSFTLPALKTEDIMRYVENLISSFTTKKEVDDIARIFSYGAGSNPREIKRFANNYALIRSFSSKSKPIKTSLLLVLQQRWPLTFQRLLLDQSEFISLVEWLQQKLNNIPTTSQEFETFVAKLPAKQKKAIDLFYIGPDFISFMKSTEIEISFSQKDLEDYLYYSSLALANNLNPEELSFEHQSTSIVDKKYSWTLFPIASKTILDQIERIEYELPPQKYSKDFRIATKENDFTISDVGNTVSRIAIKVYLKSGQAVNYLHFVHPKMDDNS